MVEQHRSALNEAKAYVRRTTVVMLGEKERAKDEKQQAKEEEEKHKLVRAVTPLYYPVYLSSGCKNFFNFSNSQATRKWACSRPC